MTPQQHAEQRPFFIVLTFILGGIAAFTLYKTPVLHALLPLTGFTVLMTIHITLHWWSAPALESEKWRLPYLLAQAALAMASVLISAAPGLALALFAALIGETLGVLGGTRLAWIAVAGWLTMAFGGYFLIGGVETVQSLLSPTLSTMIPLIIFMVLYRNQLAVSQRAQALAADLEAANRQLQAYADQVELLTLTTERQRMARELHDTLAQGLTGLVLQLEAVKAHLAQQRTERAAAIVDQSLARARGALADSRAAIDDLRSLPSSLVDAIHSKVDRFSQATGIPCELTLTLSEQESVSTTVGEHVLGIVSEALSNITRHAQATQVWVTLTFDSGSLDLMIRDNGQGFAANSTMQAGHYGLLGMRERARLINGTLTVTSESGAGTCIHVQIPMQERALS